MDRDPPSGRAPAGRGGAALLSPSQLRVDLQQSGPSASAQTTLSAESDTGIVAVSNAAQWPGLMNVSLPLS